MQVYNTQFPIGYYKNMPSDLFMLILNSNVTLYILILFTIALIYVGVMIYLKIHHIPKKAMSNSQYAQFRFINMLVFVGFVFHQIWFVALVLTFIDWQRIENWIVNISRRIKYGDNYKKHPEHNNKLGEE